MRPVATALLALTLAAPLAAGPSLQERLAALRAKHAAAPAAAAPAASPADPAPLAPPPTTSVPATGSTTAPAGTFPWSPQAKPHGRCGGGVRSKRCPGGEPRPFHAAPWDPSAAQRSGRVEAARARLEARRAALVGGAAPAP